jgi:A/G-specific adenine glycosylase
VRQTLLDWFQANARPFPWRTPGPRDAYEVLVAEALLQQTQAVRAGPAFERFVARFPTPQALATAPSSDVLTQWQGLGYYQRALRLRDCAAALVHRHGGAVPDDVAALEALPGIGRYGARAIAAQAFGRDVVAVDANVRRVGARVLALAVEGDSAIERGLEALLCSDPAPHVGGVSVTEALIELGATVCTPRAPTCSTCPLRSSCAGRGAPESYPRRRPARARRGELMVPLVARRGARVALQRRPGRGRWAGLWGFPVASAGEAPDGRDLAGFEHVVTHRTLHVRPRVVPATRLTGAVVWLTLRQVAAGGGEHPVAAVDRRVAERLLELGRPGSVREEAAA